MKTKKFLILSVLVIMISMFFSGCSYSITEEYKESQKVAEDFLTTKGYEPPKGYTVRYLDESDKQLCVNVGNYRIVFEISEGKPEILTILLFDKVIISKTSINEIEEVAYDFLNKEGYRIPEGYNIKYLGKNKKQLEVSKEEEELKITVTFFEISEKGLEIANIRWYQDEVGEIILIVLVVVFGLFMISSSVYLWLDYVFGN